MDLVLDPLLFRKSGSAENRTRICSQELWPLDHRGGRNFQDALNKWQDALNKWQELWERGLFEGDGGQWPVRHRVYVKAFVCKIEESLLMTVSVLSYPFLRNK
jgi:hypothetical protein